MVQVIQAPNPTLREVKERFHLREVRESQFFLEWQEPLPELSESEKQWLDQIKDDFFSISEDPLNEEVVKLSVLAPLLSLAGLLRPPFTPQAEKAVEVVVEDEDKLIRGRIDVLILHQRLWIVVVEAKRHSLNVSEGLAQCLFHMMASANRETPTFGFLLNGTEFQFVKLVKQENPEYSLSGLLSLRNPGNDLYRVLGTLRVLREIALS